MLKTKHHFPLVDTLTKTFEGYGDVFQLVGSVDHWLEFAGFE